MSTKFSSSIELSTFAKNIYKFCFKIEQTKKIVCHIFHTFCWTYLSILHVSDLLFVCAQLHNMQHEIHKIPTNMQHIFHIENAFFFGKNNWKYSYCKIHNNKGKNNMILNLCFSRTALDYIYHSEFDALRTSRKCFFFSWKLFCCFFHGCMKFIHSLYIRTMTFDSFKAYNKKNQKNRCVFPKFSDIHYKFCIDVSVFWGLCKVNEMFVFGFVAMLAWPTKHFCKQSAKNSI